MSLGFWDQRLVLLSPVWASFSPVKLILQVNHWQFSIEFRGNAAAPVGKKPYSKVVVRQIIWPGLTGSSGGVGQDSSEPTATFPPRNKPYSFKVSRSCEKLKLDNCQALLELEMKSGLKSNLRELQIKIAKQIKLDGCLESDPNCCSSFSTEMFPENPSPVSVWSGEKFTRKHVFFIALGRILPKPAQ